MQQNIGALASNAEVPGERSLKIEADGTQWKAAVKPKIRLLGRWLERAGFKPGERVQIRCVSPGVLEVRSAQLTAPQLQ